MTLKPIEDEIMGAVWPYGKPYPNNVVLSRGIDERIFQMSGALFTKAIQALLTTKQEMFIPVRGYEGVYEVSNTGLVKSLARKGNPERMLTPNKNRQGYLCVALSSAGKGTSFRVHRLVAHAFLSNPEAKRCINHKNGIKTDNRLENLEWSTHLENNRHAHETGLYDSRGERNNLAKLTEKQVKEIIASTGPLNPLAEKYGVSAVTICKIRLGNMWKYIPRHNLNQKKGKE